MQRFDFSGLDPAWQAVLAPFFSSLQGRQLTQALQQAVQQGLTVYPPDPYRALRLCTPQTVHVVILGQDPYHGPGQAMGLAFSVSAQVRKLPPSLRNIFKELCSEFGGDLPFSGDLTPWADQGVLLLNSVLTVEQGRAGSHGAFGWQILTDALIRAVAAKPCPHVFMLWGAWAQKKATMIRAQAVSPALILEANHPSPLSALRPPVPFMGCGHFVQANAWLAQQGCAPIRWI